MVHYPAVVASGTLRAPASESTAFPHRWTAQGVTVQAPFTGAHLLHLAVAGCVLNDVHREAQAAGIAIDGVRVSADGGFDGDWSSTGIVYTVDIASDASVEDLDRLLASSTRSPRSLGRSVPAPRCCGQAGGRS